MKGKRKREKRRERERYMPQKRKRKRETAWWPENISYVPSTSYRSGAHFSSADCHADARNHCDRCAASCRRLHVRPKPARLGCRHHENIRPSLSLFLLRPCGLFRLKDVISNVRVWSRESARSSREHGLHGSLLERQRRCRNPCDHGARAWTRCRLRGWFCVPREVRCETGRLLTQSGPPRPKRETGDSVDGLAVVRGVFVAIKTRDGCHT